MDDVRSGRSGVPMTDGDFEARATTLLHELLGQRVMFREGQLESIASVVRERNRTLVVQRTGWGKSLVYFIATKMLREEGQGPAILVSPLLSLMRDQVAAAARIGVRAARIDSSNPGDWSETEDALRRGAVDILLVSPERLGNEHFQKETLDLFQGRIGLLVVDEAHCISDWGHDFRPDYRRIVRIVRNLPPRSPLMATTATANARVVSDIEEQFGPNLRTIRGPLARASLRIQTVRLPGMASRLAWLAEHLPQLPGTGIVYCLTQRTCERVSRWLAEVGMDAPAYHAGVGEGRDELERRLIDNDVKALVATVALGMGFDKPDLGFVVHFQRPGSLVAYYQQIGRAGRALDDAVAVLLEGAEDDDVCRYFIESAFPSADQMLAVRRAIAAGEGLRVADLQREVNLGKGKIERILKLLEVDGGIYIDEGRYFASALPWTPDTGRPAAVTQRRYDELARMKEFVSARGCLMEYVTRELDDPHAGPCGRCANCGGESTRVRESEVTARLRAQAEAFISRGVVEIEPRKQWPGGGVRGRRGRIPAERLAQIGRTLCMYNEGALGEQVRAAIFEQQHISDDLVAQAAACVRRWKCEPPLAWVAAVPSSRRTLVEDFARRLARVLGLPYVQALQKARATDEQKTMENAFQQAQNVVDAFRVSPGQVPDGPVLLVDDIVRSRWTFTVCADALKAAGSGPVFPFALASAAGGDGD
jgi:ATP-dependent DNA helicase RecQ